MIDPKKNPNAVVAIEGTSMAAGIVYILSLVGVAVPGGVAILAAGAATTGLLWVGKQGLRSIPGRLWFGTDAWQARQAEKQEKATRRRKS